jgi:hypothetical protein
MKFLSTVFTILSTLALTIPQTHAGSCTPPPSGIISWWSAEGNGDDNVGTNAASVPVGVTYAPGEVGQGFNFDGGANRIIVADAPELNFGADQDFSIEAWIQPDVATTDYGVMSIVEKRNASGASDSPNGYEFCLVNGEVACRFQSTTFESTGPDLRDGFFHHAALTVSRNSTTGGKLFVDGVAVLTFDPTALNASLINSEPLRIGNHPALDLNCFFKGIIDEVSIYNRALTTNEIQAIYSASSAGKCPAPVLPSITSQPTNQTVIVGQSTSFSVSASGTPPLSYQWSFNTTNIFDATNSTLILASVQFTNAGNYAVEVTNTAGYIFSSNGVLTVNPLPPCYPPPTGLVGWWQAEGILNDTINGNYGVVSSGTVTYAPGEVGQGFNFDGGANRIIVADAPELNFGANQDFSIEAWIQPDVATTDYGVMSIVEKRVASGGSDSPNGYEFCLVNGEVACRFQSATFESTGPDLRDGFFHHVALTVSRNSITGGKLFADGVVVFTFDPTALNGSLVNSEPLRIGNHPALDLNCFFKGIIDEVSIYNRALTTNEILAVYSAGGAGKCAVPPFRPPPHTATGTATMTNTYVGGINITDNGGGYTNTPLVRFIGGGGTGAQAFAVVSNGIVVAINVLNPGYGYTNTPTVVIDPPFIFDPVLGIASVSMLNFSNLLTGTNYQLQQFQSTTWINQSASFKATNSFYTTIVPGVASSDNYRLAQIPVPVQATAFAQVFNGFVVSVRVNNPGSGYVVAPTVIIVANVGSNATAVASITNGRVTSIAVTSAGIQYVNPVTVQIDPPPVTALSPIVTQGVAINSSSLAPYDNYQIQFRPDFGTAWENLIGGLFNPPATTNVQYIFSTNNIGFFRLQYVP